ELTDEEKIKISIQQIVIFMFYTGDFRYGAGLRSIFYDLFLKFYLYFPELTLHLLPMISVIQYTKSYFVLLTITSYDPQNKFIDLRKEITKYCASFFNKIKLGIKEPTLSEKTIEMLKAWNKFFPSEGSAQMGDNTANSNRAVKRKIDILVRTIDEKKTKMFDCKTENELMQFLSNLLDMFFKLQLSNNYRKNQNILKKDKEKQQMLAFANEQIFVLSMYEAFNDIETTDQIKNIDNIKSELIKISYELMKAKKNLEIISHNFAFEELEKIGYVKEAIDQYFVEHEKNFKNNYRYSQYVPPSKDINSCTWMCSLPFGDTCIGIESLYKYFKDIEYERLIQEDSTFNAILQKYATIVDSLSNAEKAFSDLKNQCYIEQRKIENRLKEDPYYMNLLKSAQTSMEDTKMFCQTLETDAYQKFEKFVNEAIHSHLFNPTSKEDALIKTKLSELKDVINIALLKLKPSTEIYHDKTSILGADDKAGVTVLMYMIAK
ncbi:MAG: hypothetical protein EBU01_13825, partial [Crocinitomicaceae bacterium]|nr:hypothetical protein [Crocinitomicaceae bacterium]